MMRAHRASLVVALLLASVGSADCYIFAGNKLREWVDADNRISANRVREGDWQGAASLQGYVTGVIDTLDGVLICPTEGVKVGELVDIVSRYVADHPEEWNRSAALIVRSALEPVFPCKK